ncbi:HesB/IscA family protein [Qaidamihabitans albus]|uniref:HesB/IscA family protein n=1 Tax=Qaidamihabitans albus TaxID=2795733 RepID=UPI0018F13BEF|nr:iron-sulfur cluster biosynthesis family protein [Qaidamihabitans albus]
MLAMTDAAAEAISALTAQDGQDAAGLRFAVQQENESGAQLALSVAPAPEDGDQVLGTEGGARVFLEPEAASFLDDKVLDVQQDEQGQLNFAVMQQPES